MICKAMDRILSTRLLLFHCCSDSFLRHSCLTPSINSVRSINDSGSDNDSDSYSDSYNDRAVAITMTGQLRLQ